MEKTSQYQVRFSRLDSPCREVLIFAPNMSAASFKAMRQMDDGESVEQVTAVVSHLPDGSDVNGAIAQETARLTPTPAELAASSSPVPRDLPPLFPDAELRLKAAVELICAPHRPSGIS